MYMHGMLDSPGFVCDLCWRSACVGHHLPAIVSLTACDVDRHASLARCACTLTCSCVG